MAAFTEQSDISSSIGKFEMLPAYLKLIWSLNESHPNSSGSPVKLHPSNSTILPKKSEIYSSIFT